MKLIVTADLHYDISRSVHPTRKVAEEICGTRADALLILGDAAGRDVSILRECLRLFDAFSGVKMFVAGNHDIWTEPGEGSLERLERRIPAICREHGFHPLDIEPLVLGKVGFVGSIGWYDYSYRPEELNIPLRFYRAKIAPGAAARFDEHAHLLADASDVPAATLNMGCRWMDGQHVRLPMDDEKFCNHLLGRLQSHLHAIPADCRTIVAGLHHVPFEELVARSENLNWAFAAAYLGSPAFGEAILNDPRVRYAFCGHSHRAGRITRGGLECINVGCTYLEKRFEFLDF